MTLDGHSTTKNGAADEDAFNCTLFSQTGLNGDQHQLTLQNEWRGAFPTWFDVDYIVVTVGDGDTRSVPLS